MLGKLKLGTQFTLLLTLVFLVGIIVSGLILWATVQHQAEADVSTKAEILTQTMNSVRSYTSNHIKPRLEKRLASESEFIREVVPAFSARATFEQFRDRPEYHSFFYKEATLNPTNVRDRADDFETKIVEQFRRQPKLAQVSGYRTTQGENLFYIARPLAVEQSSCLQCHSNPSLAPKSLLTTYGDKNGFGWHLQEVVAAQMVYVPADEVFAHGRRNMALMMGIFTSIFAVAVLLINGLLKRRVIRPIKQLTAIARNVSAGIITVEQLKEFDNPNITQVARRADEPGQLARTFQHMAHEVATREQNLTQAVEQRTAQLAEITQEAQKAKTQAEEANSAKSQFLANMSHELRTPLNIILGFTQLMTRNSTLEAQQRGYLDTISRSGEHLLTLINNVLEMSKIEAGKTTLSETNFDLYGLLDSLQQMLRVKAESKGLQLIVERSHNLPQYIRTDEGKLRQVLMNLLGNAIKFTSAGRVTLRVARSQKSPIRSPNGKLTPDSYLLSPDSLNFEVEDTGVGIAPNELASLFEPFVQTEAGQASQEGTGLGLPISRQFVHLMGGEITVTSRLGVGTIFKFDINVGVVAADEIQTQVLTRQITGLETGQPPYRILVAEDKPENRQLLVELLAPVGFEVLEAANGQEAIAVWKRWSPHLIWMDLRMPVMDGYQATQQIKAARSQAPIIIALTGSAFEEERMVALAMGCDDFVRKPFRAETIFEKMAEFLGVRYLYAEVVGGTPTVQTRDTLPSTLNPSDLAVMPTEWIEQLHQAATRVNAKLILQLIEQIPPSHTHLTNALIYLVNHFCFEEIVELTHQQPETLV
jgi:signal transduction histidine kinase/DNA-binding NarL/FixJ family response regulator